MRIVRFFGTHFLLAAFLFFSTMTSAPVTCFAEPMGGKDSAIISMEFEGASLKDVLKVLSKQSGLNFSTNEEVDNKKVTIYLDHVPVREALDSIVSANNLRYEKRGDNVYTISTRLAESAVKTETRVIHLKYTRVSISPLDVGGASTIKELESAEQTVVFGQQASGGASSSQSDNGTGDNKKDDKGKGGKFVAERGIDKLVSIMLSGDGSVAVDMATNSLIVTDTLQKLNEIEAVLAKLDVPARQVMLEVHLMEVRKDVLDNEGVDWGGDKGALASFVGGKRTVSFPFNERIFRNVEGVKASVIDSATPASTLTLGTLNAANFQAVLHYLTTLTDTKILARPRVITMNNEAANIRLVTNTATAKLNVLASGGNISTLQTGSAERTAVGVILKITPQINDDNTVGLFVEPSVTTVSASTFFPADFLDPTTRSVRTMARVMNNQTLVIGGLVNSNQTQSNKKIPFLGDLPLVGKAFKYTSATKADTELLIFITPHIVAGYDSMSEPSATALTQDLAAKRLVNAFKQDEYERSLTSLQKSEKENQSAFLQEKELMVNNAKNIVTPEAEKAMNQALGPDSKKFQLKAPQ